MMGAEAGNMEKYKSYIQRRRVSSIQEGDDNSETYQSGSNDRSKLPAALIDDSFYFRKSTEQPESSSEESFSEYYGHVSDSIKPDIERLNTDTKYDYYQGSRPTYQKSEYAKKNADIYSRLYGQYRKTRKSPYSSESYSGHLNQNEIQDNKTTVLAIRIIKQALACFALLGVIILMQQRSDLAEAVAFIKKQVVDTHIEPQNIFAGVESAIKECSRLLGGSP